MTSNSSGRSFVEHLAAFSNVDGTSFKLVGHSNGAAIVNRILIENDNPKITHAVTDAAQLNALQYQASGPQGAGVYVGGSTNQYTTLKTSFPAPRSVLQVTGGLDTIVPSAGGTSPLDGPSNTRLSFVSWQVSAYALAQAYGFTGGVASVQSDAVADYQSVEYQTPSNVKVSAYNFENAGHGVVAVEPAASDLLRAFLGDSSGGGAVAAAFCSDGCETEFTNGCWTHFCGELQNPTGQAVFDACKAAIDNSEGGIASHCTPGCTPTTAMNEKASDTCSGNGHHTTPLSTTPHHTTPHH